MAVNEKRIKEKLNFSFEKIKKKIKKSSLINFILAIKYNINKNIKYTILY